MADKENFLQYLRGRISWGEILVGILITALLSPLIAPIITPVYLVIGVFPQPDISAEVEQVDYGYQEGAIYQRFGNLTWKSQYDIYRVHFSNDGGPTLSQAVFEVRFPGCIRGSDVPGSSGYGDITINNPLKLRLETSSNSQPESDILGCTTQIVTEDIHTNEGYTVEFVIDDQFETCDMLISYNPNRNFFVEMEWDENGQKIERRKVGTIDAPTTAFDDLSLPANTTKMTQREDYSAYLYNVGNGNPQTAMNTCYASP